MEAVRTDRQHVITLAINEDDAVFRRQALPECPCGGDRRAAATASRPLLLPQGEERFYARHRAGR